jgi:hypothetical protein
VALSVEGTSIGIADLEYRFYPAVRENPRELVLFFVADPEKTFRVPHWTFGKAETGCDFLELRVLGDQGTEFW